MRYTDPLEKEQIFRQVQNQPIKKVRRSFHRSATLEGTGRVVDGKKRQTSDSRWNRKWDGRKWNVGRKTHDGVETRWTDMECRLNDARKIWKREGWNKKAGVTAPDKTKNATNETEMSNKLRTTRWEQDKPDWNIAYTTQDEKRENSDGLKMSTE